MRFYLGIHHAHWLERAGVPVFLSARTLRGRKRLPRACAPWALDSGGFSELSENGTWTISAAAYVELVRRCQQEIGLLEWAAIQDWMCEPAILQRTGLNVVEHQRRTVQNYITLRTLAPEVPWVPVLQGWTMGEYFDHIEAYELAGIDLRKVARVGLGTVCRRQHTVRTGLLVHQLADEGLRLHAFGFKVTGLRELQPLLASADSMAWSFQARRERRGQQNSLAAALDWYHSVPGLGGQGTVEHAEA